MTKLLTMSSTSTLTQAMNTDGKDKSTPLQIGDAHPTPFMWETSTTYVTDPEQRSGFHADKSKTSNTMFNSWLHDCGLEEVEQPFHTFYGKRDGRLFSSQIDKMYHNFDYAKLVVLL